MSAKGCTTHYGPVHRPAAAVVPGAAIQGVHLCIRIKNLRTTKNEHAQYANRSIRDYFIH